MTKDILEMAFLDNQRLMNALSFGVSLAGIVIPLISLGYSAIIGWYRRYKQQVLITEINQNVAWPLMKKIILYVLDLVMGIAVFYIACIVIYIIESTCIMGRLMMQGIPWIALLFEGTLLIMMATTWKQRENGIKNMLWCVLVTLSVGYFFGIARINNIWALEVTVLILEFFWYWNISKIFNKNYEQTKWGIIVRQIRNVIFYLGIFYSVCEQYTKRLNISDCCANLYLYVTGEQVVEICLVMWMLVSLGIFMFTYCRKEKPYALEQISYVYTRDGVYCVNNSVYWKNKHVIFTYKGNNIYYNNENVIGLKYIIKGKKRLHAKRRTWKVQRKETGVFYSVDGIHKLNDNWTRLEKMDGYSKYYWIIRSDSI